MTIVNEIEDVAMGGVKILPTIGAGIGLGILISIIPVLMMSFGLKLTDMIVDKVVN